MTETMNADADVLTDSSPIHPGPGSRLRCAREARKLSVADVRSALRFKEGIVEALECDDYHGLPAPIFVKGYLRSYARLVGVGEEPVLAQYQAQVPSEPPPLTPVFPRRTLFHPRESWLVVLGGLGILAIIGALFMLRSSSDDVIAQDPGPVSEPAVESSSEQLAPAGLSEIPASAGIPETDYGEMLAEPEMGLQYTAEVPEVEPQPILAPSEHVLQFVVDEDCWTEVRDSGGKRLVYDLLKAGTTRQVVGVPPFTVLLGNAQGVHVSYDTESYDFSMYVKQNMARFQLGVVESPSGG